MAHCVAVFFTVLAFLPSFRAEGLSPDGVSLLAFKAAVNDPGGALASWNASDVNPCNWTGVWCDPQSESVLVITLPGKNLSGSLSPDLGSLRKLHRLYLQYNNFHGKIPLQITNCTRLRTLSLHHNSLIGNIPPGLENCGFLQQLYLQSNNLTGSIPSSVGNLQFLITLDLSQNFLSGKIPSIMGNMSSLINLNLSYNRLQGSIPTTGALSKFGYSSYAGNIQLCGSATFPSCKNSSSQSTASMSRGSDTTTGGSRRLSVLGIAGICIGGFLLFKGLCILILMIRWSKSSKHKEINLGSGGKLIIFQGGASLHSSKELLKSIGKLGPKDIIGEGSYGVVYKLVQKKSSIYAVKKLKQCLESLRGFEAELETLGAIKHRNLVRLLGYCASPTVKLLIYEYIPNGTLEHVLQSRGPDQKPLDWPTRHSIALGVARGLAYLHHDCNPRIIHRDVSTSNVLIDSDMQPHVADFGLARILGLDDTHVTATMGGTFGYIAPEYAEGGKATYKVDVYGFGVLLLEILTGKKATESGDTDDINLASWVRKLHQTGQVADALDEYLKTTVPIDEVQTTLLVACSCISKDPEKRPTMKQVVEILERDNLDLSESTSPQEEKVKIVS